MAYEALFVLCTDSTTEGADSNISSPGASPTHDGNAIGKEICPDTLGHSGNTAMKILGRSDRTKEDYLLLFTAS